MTRRVSETEDAISRKVDDWFVAESLAVSNVLDTSAVIASDFYDGVEAWRQRLAPLANTCRHGVLLAVSDPIEHEFPYTGRTRFSRPGSTLDRLFGRAETVRETYLDKLAAHETALTDLAGQMGWALVKHRTDESALRGAASVQAALEQFGGKA